MHLLAEGTVEHGIRVLVVAEHEGQRKHRHLGLELRQHVRATEGEVEIAELQPLLHLPLVAELPARIDAHVIFSASALLDKLREALRALAPHVVRRPHMAEPESLFRLGENLTFRADDARGSADEHYRHSPREAAPCHLDGHGCSSLMSPLPDAFSIRLTKRTLAVKAQ